MPTKHKFPKVNLMCQFSSPELAKVITMQEAMLIWDKSFTYFNEAWIRGDIEGRLSATGGTILFEYASVFNFVKREVQFNIWELYYNG